MIKTKAFPLQKFDIFLIDFFVPIVYDKVVKIGGARGKNPTKVPVFGITH